MLKSKSRLSYASRFKSSSLLTLNEIDELEKSLDWRKNYNVKSKEIGRGHFSKVYLVTSVTEDKSFAAKVIRRRKGGIDRLDKIRKEAEIIKRLNEKNVISVIHLFETFESFSEIVLICELAQGGSLFSLIQEYNTGLDETYVKYVIFKLLQALESIHSESIVHLDIKADNILLREPYPSTNIALCDFGLATELKKEKTHKELVGTPDYMAPEVVNYEKITVNTDMWSVGVLTYYLLTGESPFMGGSKDETLINVSKVRIVFHSVFKQTHFLRSKDFISSLCIKSSKLRLSSSGAQTHMWFENLHDLNINNPLESPRYSPINNFEDESNFDRNLNNYKSLPLNNPRRSQSFDFQSEVPNLPQNVLHKPLVIESSDNIVFENVQNLDGVYSNNNNLAAQERVITRILSNVSEASDELLSDTNTFVTPENLFQNTTIIIDNRSSSKQFDCKVDKLLNDDYNVDILENLSDNKLPQNNGDEENSVNVSKIPTYIDNQSNNICVQDLPLHGTRIFDWRKSQNPYSNMKELNYVECKSDMLINDFQHSESNNKLNETMSRHFVNPTEISTNIKEESSLDILKPQENLPQNDQTNIKFNSSELYVELNDFNKFENTSNSIKCDIDNFESNTELDNKFSLPSNTDKKSNDFSIKFQEKSIKSKALINESDFAYHFIGQNRQNCDDQTIEFNKRIGENDSETNIYSKKSNQFESGELDSINLDTEMEYTTRDPVAGGSFKQIEEIPDNTKQSAGDQDPSNTFEEPLRKLQYGTEINDSQMLLGITNKLSNFNVKHYDLGISNKSSSIDILNLSNSSDNAIQKDLYKIDEPGMVETDNNLVDGDALKVIDVPHSVSTVIELEKKHKNECVEIDTKIEFNDLQNHSGANFGDIPNGNYSPLYSNDITGLIPHIVDTKYADEHPYTFNPEDYSIIDSSDTTLYINTYQSVDQTKNKPNNLRLGLNTLKGIQSISKSPIHSRNMFGLNFNPSLVSHFRDRIGQNSFAKSKSRERDNMESTFDNDHYVSSRYGICKSESDDPFSDCNLPINLDEYENISPEGCERTSSRPILPRTSSSTSSGTQKSMSDVDYDDRDNLRYTAFLDHMCILL